MQIIYHVGWTNAIKLKGRQYFLPQGSIERQFVDMLATESQAVLMS